MCYVYFMTKSTSNGTSTKAVQYCRQCRDELPYLSKLPAADFIIWGKFFEPEALGPKCTMHALEWVDILYIDQSAVYDLRDSDPLDTPEEAATAPSESELAELIWRTSRADEGTISATGANIISRAILDWLRLPVPVEPELVGDAVNVIATVRAHSMLASGLTLTANDVDALVGWIADREVPAPVEPEKPCRLTLEQKADLIDFARGAIEDVWKDVGATTAQVIADNVVSAQEFAWLSMHFPVAVPVEPEWEYSLVAGVSRTIEPKPTEDQLSQVARKGWRFERRAKVGPWLPVVPVRADPQPQDTATHWANGERRLLTPEAYERLSTERSQPQSGSSA